MSYVFDLDSLDRLAAGFQPLSPRRNRIRSWPTAASRVRKPVRRGFRGPVALA